MEYIKIGTSVNIKRTDGKLVIPERIKFRSFFANNILFQFDAVDIVHGTLRSSQITLYFLL